MTAVGSVIVAVCVAFVFSLLITPLAIKALVRLKGTDLKAEPGVAIIAISRASPRLALLGAKLT